MEKSAIWTKVILRVPFLRFFKRFLKRPAPRTRSTLETELRFTQPDVCEFEAADAETVRESYRLAGVEFDRVWTADVFSDDSPRKAIESEGHCDVSDTGSRSRKPSS